jgi:hypothetical protein
MYLKHHQATVYRSQGCHHQRSQNCHHQTARLGRNQNLRVVCSGAGCLYLLLRQSHLATTTRYPSCHLYSLYQRELTVISLERHQSWLMDSFPLAVIQMGCLHRFLLQGKTFRIWHLLPQKDFRVPKRKPQRMMMEICFRSHLQMD